MSDRKVLFTSATGRTGVATAPKCGTEPIRYVSLHFRDRSGAASVRHKNRAATTVLVRGMSTDARHVALLPGRRDRERRACNDRSPFLGPSQLRPLARVFSRGWLRSSKSRACSQASKLPSSPSLTTRHIIKCVLIVPLTHSDLEIFRT